MKAVVNSTPLIALSITGYLSLLNRLFEQVVVPVSVYEEVTLQGEERPGAEAVAQVNWLVIQAPDRSLPLSAELLQLDRGEQDVILLDLYLTPMSFCEKVIVLGKNNSPKFCGAVK